MKKIKSKKTESTIPVLQDQEDFKPVTENRKNIFYQYCAYIENHVHIPSQREFAEHLQMSPSGVREHFEALANSGYLLRLVLQGTVVQYIPANIKIKFDKMNILVKDGYVNSK